MSEVKPEHVEGGAPDIEEAAGQPPIWKHCWHKSPVQHTHIKNHADIRCCHCGEDRCVALKHVPPPGHGELAPTEEWRFVPVEVIKTAGCPGAKPDAAS